MSHECLGAGGGLDRLPDQVLEMLFGGQSPGPFDHPALGPGGRFHRVLGQVRADIRRVLQLAQAVGPLHFPAQILGPFILPGRLPHDASILRDPAPDHVPVRVWFVSVPDHAPGVPALHLGLPPADGHGLRITDVLPRWEGEGNVLHRVLAARVQGAHLPELGGKLPGVPPHHRAAD